MTLSCIIVNLIVVNLSRVIKLITIVYSRTPKIEIAGLSQSHARLNLSQFQDDCLLRINSSTAILYCFKLFDSILDNLTTLTNKKY